MNICLFLGDVHHRSLAQRQTTSEVIRINSENQKEFLSLVSNASKGALIILSANVVIKLESEIELTENRLTIRGEGEGEAKSIIKCTAPDAKIRITGNKNKLQNIVIRDCNASALELGSLTQRPGFQVSLQQIDLIQNRGSISSTTGRILGSVVIEKYSKVDFVNCLFEKNEGNFGAGIYIKEPSDVSISKCRFNENKVGAIWTAIKEEDPEVSDFASRIYIENSYFMNNRKAVEMDGSTDKLESTAQGDRLESSMFIPFKYPGFIAGAMFIQSVDQVNIERCVFVGNGARRVGAVLLSDNREVHISESSFINNSAVAADQQESYGGAIYYRQVNIDEAMLNISNSYFDGNYAGSGGAIHTVGSHVTDIRITRGIFRGNSARFYGGAVVFRSSQVNLEGAHFEKNKAESGGAMAVLNGASLDVVGASFMDRDAQETVKTAFSNNKAIDGGALFFAGSNNVRVSQARFLHNIASRDGGAACVVYTLSGSVTKLEGCFFRENEADRGGAYFGTGASEVVFRGGTSEVRLDHPKLARYLAEDKADVIEGFLQNKAVAGGAIYILGSNPFVNKLTMSNIVFSGNQALIPTQQQDTTVASNANSTNRISQPRSAYLNVLADDPCYPGGGGVACLALNNLSPRAYGNYEIQDVQFINNTASVGGALLIATFGNWSTHEKQKCAESGKNCFQLTNSTFQNNSAIGAGGAIFSTYPNHILFAHDNNVSNIDTLDQVQFPNPSFRRNIVHSTGYGSNVGSIATALEMQSPQEDLQNLESGGAPCQMKVCLLDAYNQTVLGNIMDSVMMLSVISEHGFASGDLQSAISHGCTEFDVVITASPGSYEMHIHGDRSEIVLSINVSTRGCYVGEHNVKNLLCNRCPEGSFSFDINIDCQTCPAKAKCLGGAVLVPQEGYWHSTPFSPVIHNCQNQQGCTTEGRQKKLEEFYEKNTINRNLTLAPRPFEEEYPQCHKGYEGVLCGSCSAGYGHVANGRCRSCTNETRTRFLVAFSAIWMLLLMAFTIRSALISIRDFIAVKNHVQSTAIHAQNISAPMSPNIGAALPTLNGQILCLPSARSSHSSDSDGICPSPTFRGSSGVPTVPPVAPPAILNSPPPQAAHLQTTTPIDHILAAEKISETIKIFTNFLQITSVGILINVEWTGAVEQVLTLNDGIAGFSNGSSIAPLECIVGGSSGQRSIRHAILRIFMPFMLLVITISFFAIHWLRLRARQNKPFSYLKSRMVICALVASFFSYHKVTEHFMRILNCMHLDYGRDLSSEKCPSCRFYGQYAVAREYYWAEDTSLLCFKGSHAKLAYFLGLPGLFLFSLGVPLTILGTLMYNKAHDCLHNIEVLNTFGFVYQNYKDHFMFWEVCIMCRKAAVGAIVVFAYSLGGNLQSVMILGTLLIALLSQIAAFPFNDYALNCLETSSLLVSILTFYFAIVFNDPNTSDHAKNTFSVVLLILTTALVIVFFAVLVYNMDAFVEAKLKQMGHTVPRGRLQRPFKLLRVIFSTIFYSVYDKVTMRLHTIKMNRERRRLARRQRQEDKTNAAVTHSAAATNSANQSAPSSHGTASLQVNSIGTSITINPSN